MAYTVAQLIEGQTIICAQRQELVRTALERMVEKDFSQLPVVDEDGYLLGLLSEQSIVRTSFFLNDDSLHLTVDNCLAKAVTIAPDAEVFDAQTRLKDAPALVVIEGKKPVGVLTYYDTTRFFSDVGEGLMYVEDIETGLRRYIEAFFNTKEKLDAALFRAFGIDKRDPTQPRVLYDKMNFSEHIDFIVHEKNWPIFEPYFSSSKVLQQVTSGVRDIRNQLAHFRGRLTPVQRQALLRARDWLAARPRIKQKSAGETITGSASVQLGSLVVTARGTVGYAALQAWLAQTPRSSKVVKRTFRELEELISADLPESARVHSAWWTNDPGVYSQSRSWLTAGWRVSEVDLEMETVTFEKSHDVLYQPFFVDLLSRVQQLQTEFASGISAGARHWLDFASGKPGVRLGWSFTKQHTLRVELYIDTGNKNKNQEFFNSLLRQSAQIEAEFGAELTWEPLEHSRACRVGIETPGTISDPPEKLDALIEWGSLTMIKFANTFRSRLV